MKKLMDSLYSNIDEAKAFALSFTSFVYFSDNDDSVNYTEVVCEECGKEVQTKDYRFPQSNCRKPTGILHTLEFGVSPEVRDELIARFDITEEDFRPIRNRRGKIIYYQVTPQHVMLPIHKENEWVELPPCPKCGDIQFRDYCYKDPKYRNAKKEFFYYISQEALDDMHDLNVTYEKFEFYMPEYMISRRVYDYLTEKYPRTHYFPFFLKK